MSKYFQIILIILLVSCAAFKSQKVNKKVIEGSYKIVQREANPNNPNSVITGIVYDKETNNPIKGAIVQIEDLKKGEFTDEKGRYSLEIEKKGLHKVQAVNVGHTKISTDSIKLESKTKVQIDFYLGTTIEY